MIVPLDGLKDFLPYLNDLDGCNSKILQIRVTYLILLAFLEREPEPESTNISCTFSVQNDTECNYTAIPKVLQSSSSTLPTRAEHYQITDQPRRRVLRWYRDALKYEIKHFEKQKCFYGNSKCWFVYWYFSLSFAVFS